VEEGRKKKEEGRKRLKKRSNERRARERRAIVFSCLSFAIISSLSFATLRFSLCTHSFSLPLSFFLDDNRDAICVLTGTRKREKRTDIAKGKS